MSKLIIRILAFLLSLGILLDPARSAALALHQPSVVQARIAPAADPNTQALTLALGGAVFAVTLVQPSPFVHLVQEYRHWISLALYGSMMVAPWMVMASGDPWGNPEAVGGGTGLRGSGSTFSTIYVGPEKGRVYPLTLRRIQGAESSLIEEWGSEGRFQNFWRMSQAGNGEGFQLLSHDSHGQAHLEAWVRFKEFDGMIQIKQITEAPWNTHGEHYKGLAAILLARIIQESFRRGHRGAIFALPLKDEGIAFFQRIGAKPFRDIAPLAGLPIREDSTEANHYVGLSPDSARALLEAQTSSQGPVPVVDMTHTASGRPIESVETSVTATRTRIGVSPVIEAPVSPALVALMDAYLQRPYRNRVLVAQIENDYGYRVYPIRELGDIFALYWKEGYGLAAWFRSLNLDRESFQIPLRWFGREWIVKHPGDSAVLHLVKELASNIWKHGGWSGMILLRDHQGHLEILARDQGPGIEDIPRSMERGETRWRIWGYQFSRGMGLPDARDIAVSGGLGQLTVMSRRRQVTYRENHSPIEETSAIHQGSLVQVLRVIPPAPVASVSKEPGPRTERNYFGPDGKLGDPRRGANPMLGDFPPGAVRSGVHFNAPIRSGRGNMDSLASRPSPAVRPAPKLTVFDQTSLRFYQRSPVLQSYPPQDLYGTLLWLSQRRKELNGSSLGYLVQALANARRLPPGVDSDYWQRAAGAFDFYLQQPLLQRFVPTDLPSTLEWLRSRRAELNGKSLRYLMQTLVVARRLPANANMEYWERSAGAYDFYLDTPLLNEYRPEDLRTTLHWLSEHRRELGNNSLSYLMHALSMGGALPARANAEDWQRSAGAYDFYLNSSLLQSYQTVELPETLAWLQKNRAALGNNTLSYLIHALAMADRLPVKASMETWKRMVASYDFYLDSPLLQSYQPVELQATLAWMAEHRHELDDNSLSYLMQAWIMAGKLPEAANPEHWQRSAGAYDRAVKEKPTISREIHRIWGLPAAPGEFRTPLARLKSMFAPELLPHAVTGKVLSASYRNVILTFAWIIYGEPLATKLADVLDPSTPETQGIGESAPLFRVIWEGVPGDMAHPNPQAPAGSIQLRSDADARALLPDLSDLSREFDFEIAVRINQPNEVHSQVLARDKSGAPGTEAFLAFYITLRADRQHPNAVILGNGIQPPAWKQKLHHARPDSLGPRYRSWFNGRFPAWVRDHGLDEIVVTNVVYPEFLQWVGFEMEPEELFARKRVSAPAHDSLTNSIPVIPREEFASHGVNPEWLSNNFLPEIEARSVRQWEHLTDPTLPLQVRLFEINPDIQGSDSLFKLVGINSDQRPIGRLVGVVEHDARGDYLQVMDLELSPRYRFLYQMLHAITLFVLQGRIISRLRSSDAPNDFARRVYERLSQDPRLLVRHVQINGKPGYYEVEKSITPAVRERRSPALARAA